MLESIGTKQPSEREKMYVIYRRKGFQDTPVECLEDETEAKAALAQFRRTGYYFLLQEDRDSYAVQRLRKNAPHD